MSAEAGLSTGFIQQGRPSFHNKTPQAQRVQPAPFTDAPSVPTANLLSPNPGRPSQSSERSADEPYAFLKHDPVRRSEDSNVRRSVSFDLNAALSSPAPSMLMWPAASLVGDDDTPRPSMSSYYSQQDGAARYVGAGKLASGGAVLTQVEANRSIARMSVHICCCLFSAIFALPFCIVKIQTPTRAAGMAPSVLLLVAICISSMRKCIFVTISDGLGSFGSTVLALQVALSEGFWAARKRSQPIAIESRSSSPMENAPTAEKGSIAPTHSSYATAPDSTAQMNRNKMSTATRATHATNASGATAYSYFSGVPGVPLNSEHSVADVPARSLIKFEAADCSGKHMSRLSRFLQMALPTPKLMLLPDKTQESKENSLSEGRLRRANMSTITLKRPRSQSVGVRSMGSAPDPFVNASRLSLGRARSPSEPGQSRRTPTPHQSRPGTPYESRCGTPTHRNSGAPFSSTAVLVDAEPLPVSMAFFEGELVPALVRDIRVRQSLEEERGEITVEEEQPKPTHFGSIAASSAFKRRTANRAHRYSLPVCLNLFSLSEASLTMSQIVETPSQTSFDAEDSAMATGIAEIADSSDDSRALRRRSWQRKPTELSPADRTPVRPTSLRSHRSTMSLDDAFQSTRPLSDVSRISARPISLLAGESFQLGTYDEEDEEDQYEMTPMPNNSFSGEIVIEDNNDVEVLDERSLSCSSPLPTEEQAPRPRPVSPFDRPLPALPNQQTPVNSPNVRRTGESKTPSIRELQQPSHAPIFEEQDDDDQPLAAVVRKARSSVGSNDGSIIERDVSSIKRDSVSSDGSRHSRYSSAESVTSEGFTNMLKTNSATWEEARSASPEPERPRSALRPLRLVQQASARKSLDEVKPVKKALKNTIHVMSDEVADSPKRRTKSSIGDQENTPAVSWTSESLGFPLIHTGSPLQTRHRAHTSMDRLRESIELHCESPLPAPPASSALFKSTTQPLRLRSSTISQIPKPLQLSTATAQIVEQPKKTYHTKSNASSSIASMR